MCCRFRGAPDSFSLLVTLSSSNSLLSLSSSLLLLSPSRHLCLHSFQLLGRSGCVRFLPCVVRPPLLLPLVLSFLLLRCARLLLLRVVVLLLLPGLACTASRACAGRATIVQRRSPAPHCFHTSRQVAHLHPLVLEVPVQLALPPSRVLEMEDAWSRVLARSCFVLRGRRMGVDKSAKCRCDTHMLNSNSCACRPSIVRPVCRIILFTCLPSRRWGERGSLNRYRSRLGGFRWDRWTCWPWGDTERVRRLFRAKGIGQLLCLHTNLTTRIMFLSSVSSTHEAVERVCVVRSRSHSHGTARQSKHDKGRATHSRAISSRSQVRRHLQHCLTPCTSRTYPTPVSVSVTL